MKNRYEEVQGADARHEKSALASSWRACGEPGKPLRVGRHSSHDSICAFKPVSNIGRYIRPLKPGIVWV